MENLLMYAMLHLLNELAARSSARLLAPGA